MAQFPALSNTPLQFKMAKDKLGENDKPDWSGPTATKFDKYVHGLIRASSEETDS